MAYTKRQRSDKGFDFFDDKGKKITIEQYTQATGANGSDLRKELAKSGDKVSQQIISTDNLGRIGKNLTNFGRTIGAGIQQGAGSALDVALQGGAIVGELGNSTNPFISEQLKKQRESSQIASTENLRKLLQTQKDLEGKTIVGTSNVDENASKIASGQGDARDVAAVLGKGLEVANTATMFANPLSLAKGATAKQVIQRAGADAGLFGATGGGQAGLQTYGDTGNLGQAAKAAAQGAILSGATAGALDIAAPVAGAIARNASKAPQAVVNTVNEARPSVIASKDPRVTGFDDQYNTLAQQFDTVTDPIARREVSKAMAQNRVQRLNTQKGIEREVGQGGYVRIPGGDEASATPNVDRTLDTPEQIQPEFSQAPQPQKYDLGYIDGERKPLTQDEMTDKIFSLNSIPKNERSLAQQDSLNKLTRASKEIDSEAVSAGSVNDGGIPQQVTQNADNIPPQSQSRFASQTAPNSGNLSDDLAQAVRENASSYTKTTNVGSVEDSIDFLKTRTEDEAIDDVFNRLNQKNIDRQTVTDAIAVASSLDAKGGTRNLEIAQNIYDTLSVQLTKAGQTVQAASIISRRTPEGMAYNATRELQKAGVQVTPEIREAIIKQTQEIGQLKLGSPERDIAVAELQKDVNRLIPTEFIDKLVGTWKAGLLTGIRTTTGGALSNALFRGLREVSRPGAVALDMVVSLFTGKRTTALTTKGAWGGTAEGLKKGLKSLKTGIDERSFSADGKYIDREINFKNKALGTYVNGVFRVMGAADRPFYYSQFRNSLAEASIVEAKNLKLRGKDFDEYVLNAIDNPTGEAVQYATDVAQQAVLGNDTLLSNVANKLREAVSKQENAAVRATGKAAIGVLAPFTKVPSAFLSRVIDFTPIGAVKEAVTQMANKSLNQQRLVQAISEAGTGTGLIYLGSELANNDLLTGNYPNDQTEQNRWKAEGIIPNAVKVGNTYYSLNYAGPVGALFGIGKSIADAAKEGGDVTAALTAGVTQLASGTLEQSFLSGISGALDAVQDPKRYAENFVRSQAGSVVPTLLNDVGNATDETQRQTNTPLEAIQGRIPGARTGLNPKIDSLGNELTQANPDKLGRLVDPLRPSQAKSNDITNELDRLAKAGQPIFPSNDKTLKVSNETIKLDGDQQYQYNQGVGQETTLIWQGIIKSPEYEALNDEQKKEMLANSATDINAVAKKQYLESIGKQDTADKVAYTKRQQTYADGVIDPTLWLPKDSEASIAKTNEVKTAKANAKKASSKKVGRKSSGSRKIGFKAPTSGGFKRTSTTAALNKLLSSAGSTIKAKSIG